MTPSERNKYLAEVKVRKEAEGYATSDPAGVTHRKAKRKDIISKDDAVTVQVDTELENVEQVVDRTGAEIVDSPKRKKGRTGKRNNVGDKSVHTAATTSSNDKVGESFWHKEFNFRRYN